MDIGRKWLQEPRLPFDNLGDSRDESANPVGTLGKFAGKQIHYFEILENSTRDIAAPRDRLARDA
jgi:hypothetical protein